MFFGAFSPHFSRVVGVGGVGGLLSVNGYQKWWPPARGVMSSHQRREYSIEYRVEVVVALVCGTKEGTKNKLLT